MGEACVRGNASNGDGVYKSTDGGKTWRNVGLKETYHIGAVRVHPKNPDIVYVAALGHLWGPNPERGVYRSTDGGPTWKLVLTKGPHAGAVEIAVDPGNLRQRAWYYSHIFADTRSADTLYALNVGMYKSIDAGRTWTPINPPHGDNHALWIAPDNPLRMIQGNDGGATITNDGGRTWSTVM